MIKLIKSNELKLGMFISGFNESWFNTPFLKNSFKLNNNSQITKILSSNLKEVYIDTEKGVDISMPKQAKPTVPIQIKEKSIDQKTSTINITEQHQNFVGEIGKAKVIKKEISIITSNILKNVNSNKKIDSQPIKNLSESIVESLYRNNYALSSLLKLKHTNENLFHHSVNVAILAPSFGRYLNMSKEDLVILGTGGLLHDLGKVKIPRHILEKTKSLTQQDMELIKKHVEYTVEQLKIIENLPTEAIDIAQQHHERSNGSGYPAGLMEDDISIYSKIVSIVNLFENLTSKGNNKQALLQSEALILIKGMKKKFQAKLLESFLGFIGIYPVGSYVLLSNNIIGAVVANNKPHPDYPVIKKIINANGFRSSTSPLIDLSDQVFEYKNHTRVVREVLPIDYELPPFNELEL